MIFSPVMVCQFDWQLQRHGEWRRWAGAAAMALLSWGSKKT
jgi:hypothetical protein